MRIAFYIPLLNIGGAEKVIINLLKELSKSNVCYLITDSYNSTWISEIDNNIKIINLNSKHNFLNRLFSLYKIIKENEFNIVVSHLTHSNIHCLLVKLIRRYNLIIVEHSITSQYIERLGKVNFFTKKFLIKSLFNLSNLIVSVSETTKRDLVSKFSVKQDKCIVIYNPLDFDEIDKLAKEVIEEDLDNKVSNRKILISVGRLEKLKNHFFLIDAVKDLLRNQNLCLIIVGDGDQKKMLQDKINEESLNDYIYLAGFDNNPYKYITRSTVLIHPSKFEGFGLVLIEAIYLSRSVISMDFEASFEVLEEGKFGEIVNDKQTLLNALIQTLALPSSKEQMDDMSNQVQSKYNVQLIASQYLLAFNKICSQ